MTVTSFSATDSTITANNFQNAFGRLWTRGMELSVLGQPTMTWTMVMALLTGENVLLTGEPGTAKSYSCEVLAKLAFGSQSDYYGRVQGTPDKQPSSMVGGLTYNPSSGEMVVRKGPLLRYILSHVDEINRMPPKTQAALLQALQEGSAEIDGVSYPVRPGFTVTSTMNRGSEATYEVLDPLVDRFGFSARSTLPSAENRALIRAKRFRQLQDITPVFGSVEEYLEMVAYVNECASAPRDDTNDYITRVVDEFRKPDSWYKMPKGRDGEYEPTIGIRAEMALLKGATVKALSEGREFAEPADVYYVLPAVFNHRLTIESEHKDNGTVRMQIGETLKRAGLSSPDVITPKKKEN